MTQNEISQSFLKTKNVKTVNVSIVKKSTGYIVYKLFIILKEKKLDWAERVDASVSMAKN